MNGSSHLRLRALRSLSPFLLGALAIASSQCSSSSTDTPTPGADGGATTGGSTTGGGSTTSGGATTGGGSTPGGGGGGSTTGGGGSTTGGGGFDGGVPPGVGHSVLQRGNDYYRRGTYTQPGLTRAAAATMAPNTEFNTNATFPANGSLTNQGTASVLYLEQGPTTAGCPTGATGCAATARTAGSGLFFAFPALNANPNVVAIDETSGKTVWTAHITTGGDGVRGTPVVDPDTRRLYVVTGGNPHLVHAISVDDGKEITTGGWPVTLSSTTVSYAGNGTTQTFNSGGQNQRGASLLVNKRP